MSLMLIPERVYSAVAPRPVRFYERVDSTNELALEWLRQGAETGSVIIADEQVKGRGRLGRAWYTPPGTALILSVILRPASSEIQQLTMLGAVAICELLEHIGAPDVGIKWPNDVQLLGRKVSGILPEVVWSGRHVDGAVLGMGINVRIDFAGTALADRAISIEPVLGRLIDRLDALVYLLNRIDEWTPQLGTKALFDAWRERLNMLGRRVTVVGADGMLTGWAETVDEDGALRVKTDDGTIHRVIAGDVVLGSSS